MLHHNLDLPSNVPLQLTSVRYRVAPLRGALSETLAAERGAP